MNRFFINTALFLWPVVSLFLPVVARSQVLQNGFLPDEGRAPWRTGFISYDIRDEADAEVAVGSKYFRALVFKPVSAASDVWEATVAIPPLWLDRAVFIRDSGRTGRYILTINGLEAGVNTDTYTGAEWLVTPMLREGDNRIAIRMLAPGTDGSDMESFVPDAARKTIETLSLFSQPRIRIFDYTASGHYDAEFKDAVIDLAVVVVNDFNMSERVRVAYDIYDPAGKLKDFAYVEADIPGRGCDTVRLLYKVTGTARNHYSAANPSLYRVTLSLRHGGRDIEYIPFRVGFGVTSFDGSIIRRDGVPIVVRSFEGDFPVSRGLSDRLRSLKRQGYNTIAVARPQQKWFYDAALAEGLWVIDRAAVECDPRGGDRTPSGTLANDPALLPRFLDRAAAMFYRRRNYPNVIAWSLGTPSGNGFCMYRAYFLLKSLDSTRPVIYSGAEGEFNNDL